MTQKYANIFLFTRILVSLSGLFLCANSFAGTFSFAEVTGVPDSITHPTSYTGNGQGGTLTVSVCIDPNSANAAAMEIPIQNNINIYNQLQQTTGNIFLGGTNNVPGGWLDFESVALHEIGHCLGLGHTNVAFESGLTEANQDYTRAMKGNNSVFDINPGADGEIGSFDDIRGDDVNLHWFRTSNNNPFTIDSPVDSSTYARNTSNLPVGHSFAANGTRAVASDLGFSNTEVVMNQGTFFDEAQRTLAHDDVATLLYAASGKNEVAGDNDDYTIQLEYGGLASNCDINIDFDDSKTGLAVCIAGASGLSGSDHVSITSANIYFNDANYSWFFNPETVNQAPVLAPIGDQPVTEGQSVSVGLSATNLDGDTQVISATGLPGFANLTDHGDDTATLDINPPSGQAGTYPVTITVTDNGLPVLDDSETFDIIVSTPNQAPVLAPIGNQLVGEGQSASVGLSATNPDGDTQSFSSIGLPAFATLTDYGNDTAMLAINPQSGDEGTYPVTITVTDNGVPVLDDSESFDIIVTIVDSDGDGIDDATELTLGTNPNNADTDGDGLADGADGVILLADLSGGIDTDGDGFVDGEQDFGSSPLVSNVGDVAPRGAPDNVLNAADILVLMQLATGSATASSLEAVLGDINGIDQINVADVLLLQQLVLGLP